jgi:hypothetical protein
MAEDLDDWSDIEAHRGSRTERRADPDHPLDFFRARGPEGNYILLLRGVDLLDSSKFPIFSGIEIALNEAESRPKELILKLLDTEQKSIFRALVADILGATRDLGRGQNPAGAMRVITRVERWQELLKKRRSQLLSRQEIIGLFGELSFLLNYVMPNMQSTDAAASWRGPFGEEQDFAIGDWIVEIKTQLSTADQFLKISSEAQLDTASGQIIVYHHNLSPAQAEDETAMSLNGIVDAIRSEMLSSGASALDIFEAGLISAGYVSRPEYDKESWKVVKRSIFEVEGAFPRLSPSNLPIGVRHVTYKVIPAACKDFERTESWLIQSLF